MKCNDKQRKWRICNDLPNVIPNRHSTFSVSNVMRPIPIKFGLPGGIKQLRVERHKSDGWVIWLSANAEFTLGTYILLCDNGEIKRCTIHPDGHEEVYAYADK